MRQSLLARPTLLSCAVLLALAGTACKPRTFNEGSGTTQDAWNSQNDPSAFFNTRGVSLSFRFDDRKTSGRLSREPWSETYWPDFAGGIATRWSDPTGLHPGCVEEKRDAQGNILRTSRGEPVMTWLPPPAVPGDAWSYKLHTRDELKRLSSDQRARLSPAEKYDIYMGRYDYPTVQAERQRVKRNSEKWWGLCHAWAPASMLVEEPKAVEVTNADGIRIPFASSDIKGIVIHHFHATNQVLTDADDRRVGIGGRCERVRNRVDPTDDRTNQGQGSQDECKDVNAGAWHVLLTNLVRENSPTNGFVFDMDKTSEVWNQPVYRYEASYQRMNTMHRGADRRARSSIRVTSSVWYGREVAPAWEGNISSRTNALGKLDLEYYLEVDDRGNIIGGEWITNDFPDFVWYRPRPRSFAFRAGNVDYSGIDRLLAASSSSRSRLSPPTPLNVALLSPQAVPCPGSWRNGARVPATAGSAPAPSAPPSTGTGSTPATSTNPRPSTTTGTVTAPPGSVVVPAVPEFSSTIVVFTDPFLVPLGTTGTGEGVFLPNGTTSTSTDRPSTPAGRPAPEDCARFNRWECSRGWDTCGWNSATNKCYARRR